MQYALNQYEIPKCDISTCPYSSRLYRVPDQSSKINIFDKEDKESSLPVVIDIIDSIHHFLMHIFECGLRDIGDNRPNDDSDVEKEKNEYYDKEFARMSARISSTRNNTQRFNRINTSNKFNINIGNKSNNLSKDETDSPK